MSIGRDRHLSFEEREQIAIWQLEGNRWGGRPSTASMCQGSGVEKWSVSAGRWPTGRAMIGFLGLSTSPRSRRSERLARDVAWHVHPALGVAPPVGHRWLSCHQGQPMTITTARRRPDGGGGGAPSATLCSTSSTKLLMRALPSASTKTSSAVVVTRAWVTARPRGRPGRRRSRRVSRARRWRDPARAWSR